jgi:hypothetical protein
MAGIIDEITSELADNWPAFVYIAMSLVFSVFFFRERRAEVRLTRQIGENIEETIRARFDRLEAMLRDSPIPGTPDLSTERVSDDGAKPQFFTPIVSELTAFLPVIPSRPARRPR